MKCCRQHCIDSSLGFTLVEILITIGVVAILTSMAVPTVQIYTEKARKVECQASIVHYLRAQEIYCAENGSFHSQGSWKDTKNGAKRLNIGWASNKRPDQADLYRFPELGVELRRDNHRGYRIRVWNDKKSGSYRQEIFFQFKTKEDFDHDGDEDLYSYRKYLRPTTSGQWRVRNKFWFDIDGCPAWRTCR